MKTNRLLIIPVILLASFILSCNKNHSGTYVPPWHFTLNEGNYHYSIFADGFHSVHSSDEPAYLSVSLVDSVNYAFMVSFFDGEKQARRNQLGLTITEHDPVLSKRLLKTNNMLDREAAIISIFSPGRIFPFYISGSGQPGFFCSYQNGDGRPYAQNFNVSNPGDFIKITKSQVFGYSSPDGGSLNCKVSLEYSIHVEEFDSTGTFLGNIKLLTGTMDTFFTVE